MRHQAGLVEAALQDRLAVEYRATQLAHELAEVRAQLRALGGAADLPRAHDVEPPHAFTTLYERAGSPEPTERPLDGPDPFGDSLAHDDRDRVVRTSRWGGTGVGDPSESGVTRTGLYAAPDLLDDEPLAHDDARPEPTRLTETGELEAVAASESPTDPDDPDADPVEPPPMHGPDRERQEHTEDDELTGSFARLRRWRHPS
ncbi:MAG: hypothetical protein LH468_06190 [Nocardioides sp.]|nr:hypothetical protein [Nocardioides sp.]